MNPPDGLLNLGWHKQGDERFEVFVDTADMHRPWRRYADGRWEHEPYKPRTLEAQLAMHEDALYAALREETRPHVRELMRRSLGNVAKTLAVVEELRRATDGEGES